MASSSLTTRYGDWQDWSVVATLEEAELLVRTFGCRCRIVEVTRRVVLLSEGNGK